MFVSSTLLSLVIIGIFPAKVLLQNVMDWMWTAVLFSWLIGMPLMAAVIWIRRRGRRFNMIHMFAIVTICCALFAFLGFLVRNNVLSDGPPWGLDVPSQGMNYFELVPRGQAKDLKLVRVLDQWTRYHGPYLTVVSWFGGMLFCWIIKLVWTRPEDFAAASLGRRLGTMLHSMGESMLAGAVVFLAVFLAAAPTVIYVVEEDFQENTSYPRDPAAHWNRLESAISEVRQDSELMADLQAQVDDQMLRYDEEARTSLDDKPV